MPENAQIVFTPATLPEGSCFASEQERFNAFGSYLSGYLPDNYSTVNFGPDAPEANDRDKPWFRSNSDGSPDGVYFYFNGSWKRTHPLDPGHIHLWLGSAGAVDSLDGGAAGTATVDAGPFWEVVADFAAKFPVGVGTFASGTNVAVAGTGGEDRHTLSTQELPEVLGRLGDGIEKILAKKDSGAGNVSFGSIAGSWQSYENLSDAIRGGTAATDKSHQNLPPYLGVYMIRRSIRRWYSI